MWPDLKKAGGILRSLPALHDNFPFQRLRERLAIHGCANAAVFGEDMNLKSLLLPPSSLLLSLSISLLLLFLESLRALIKS